MSEAQTLRTPLIYWYR